MKKKKLFNTLISVLIVVLVIADTLLIDKSFCDWNKPNTQYEYVLKDVVKNETKIVDIAMLGSHDSFSDNISNKSNTNVNEDNIVNNDYVNFFGKGFATRMSKAQTCGAKDQLYAGVRYFDVRITKIDDSYYTHHGYLSDYLYVYLQEVVDFLGSHNGEYIIFDIQHFITKDTENYSISQEEYQNLFDYIESFKNSSNKSILDYINYDTSTDDIGNLTYGQVTKNGSESGVVLLAKTNEFNFAYLRDNDGNYDENRNYKSIRSYWHNKNSDKEMLDGIENEYQFVKAHDYSNKLVINQAQKTAFIASADIIRSVFSWSLLDMANNFNAKLVEDKDRFVRWLDYMPILMVDNSTSNKKDFNKKANEYIKEFNYNL